MRAMPPQEDGSSSQSVSEWIAKLKAGGSAAGQQLWRRYVDRLARLASRRLGNAPKTVADEEDVVLSAFQAFFQGVADGRFSRLDDRDDLWQVLVMLTERKAIGLRRRATADKRGGGEVRGESALIGPDADEAPGMAQVADSEPTPEFAAQAAEELALRLAALEQEPEWKRIALDKLAGYTNAEIAHRLGTSLRSVERQLTLIRAVWSQDRP